MNERRTLRTKGEVIEEYRRDYPAEIVETYVRPLPGAASPAAPAPAEARPRKKRRWLKGLLILLAAAAALALLAGRCPLAAGAVPVP